MGIGMGWDMYWDGVFRGTMDSRKVQRAGLLSATAAHQLAHVESAHALHHVLHSAHACWVVGVVELHCALLVGEGVGAGGGGAAVMAHDVPPICLTKPAGSMLEIWFMLRGAMLPPFPTLRPFIFFMIFWKCLNWSSSSLTSRSDRPEPRAMRMMRVSRPFLGVVSSVSSSSSAYVLS